MGGSGGGKMETLVLEQSKNAKYMYKNKKDMMQHVHVVNPKGPEPKRLMNPKGPVL